MTASGMDGLRSCLECLLSPDASIRRHAERGLEEAERVSGCGLALAEIAQAPGLALDLRQLAALLLRTHIRKHWTEESPAFREPPMTVQEKAALRASLPAGLADPARKLRTAAGMAVAAVAKWDCPEAWPELLPGMLAVLAQKPSAQHGARGCPGCHGAGVCRTGPAGRWHACAVQGGGEGEQGPWRPGSRLGLPTPWVRCR